MNPTSKRRLSVTVPILAMAIAVLAGRPGFGQGTFGRVANQPFSGGVTVVDQMPARILGPRPGISKTMSIELGGALQQAWQGMRPGLQKDIENYLHERDIGGGFRTSANHVWLAETWQLFAGTDGRGFTVRLLLPGNRLDTRIRIPAFTAQSSDPALSLPFDIEAVIDADVNGMQLKARSARVRLIPRDVQGGNPTGKPTVEAAKLTSFFARADFQGEVARRINRRQRTFDGAINRELAKVNSVMSKAGNDVVLQPGFDPSRRNIQITLVKTSPGPAK